MVSPMVTDENACPATVATPAPTSVADLFTAADEGDFELIATTVKSNPKFPGLGEPQGRGKQTLLHIMAYEGHVDACKALCAANVNKDAQDNLGATPLHLAAMEGNVECVETLIYDGARIMANHRMKTPLHEAAFNSHADVVESLIPVVLLSGMIDAVCDGNRTALHDAAVSPCHRMVFALLGAGAKVNEVDNKNWTPLDWAYRMYDLTGRMDILDKLKAAGAVLGADISGNKKIVNSSSKE